MQTFFLLSGFTLSFDNKGRIFIVKQIKGLLIPFITFSILTTLINMIFFDGSFYVEVGGERFLSFFENLWFLPALFLGKSLTWTFAKMNNNRSFVFVCLIIVLLLGFAITQTYIEMPDPAHYHNYFHYRNGLCMAIFIYIGYCIKRTMNSKILLMSSVICVAYYACIVGLHLFSHSIPYIEAPDYTHTLAINKGLNAFGLIIPYLFFSFTGSCLVIYISLKIKGCHFLEEFGKHSLVIYCIHIEILMFLVKILSIFWIPNSYFMSFLYFIIIAIASTFISLYISRQFYKGKLRYLIGKY